MNFAGLLKAFDTVVALGEVARRMTAPPPRPSAGAADPGELAQSPGMGGQLEARLTGVVVAALKEAFDRDHKRLELERAQMEEQRRRAEEALRLEMRRQAIDRELGRLRLLAGAALLGWASSLVVLVIRIGDMALASRLVLAGGWLLLLGSIVAAFTAQARIGGDGSAADGPREASRLESGALWLLSAGLALCATSVLLIGANP
jgi:hypothetical protein